MTLDKKEASKEFKKNLDPMEKVLSFMSWFCLITLILTIVSIGVWDVSPKGSIIFLMSTYGIQGFFFAFLMTAVPAALWTFMGNKYSKKRFLESIDREYNETKL